MKAKRIFKFAQIEAEAKQMGGEKGKGLGLCRAGLAKGYAPKESHYLSSGVHILPPQVSIAYHQHLGTEEVYFVLKGCGIYTGQDKVEHEVVAGDTMFCYAGEFHGLVNRSTEDLQIAAVINKI